MWSEFSFVLSFNNESFKDSVWEFRYWSLWDIFKNLLVLEISNTVEIIQPARVSLLDIFKNLLVFEIWNTVEIILAT